jgi:hypothetical protein
MAVAPAGRTNSMDCGTFEGSVIPQGTRQQSQGPYGIYLEPYLALLRGYHIELHEKMDAVTTMDLIFFGITASVALSYRTSLENWRYMLRNKRSSEMTERHCTLLFVHK